MHPTFSPPPSKALTPALTVSPRLTTPIPPPSRAAVRFSPRTVSPSVSRVAPCVQPAHTALLRATVVYADYLGDLCVFDLIHDVRLLQPDSHPAAIALVLFGIVLGAQLAAVLTVIVYHLDAAFVRLSTNLRTKTSSQSDQCAQNEQPNTIRVAQAHDSPLSPPDIFARLYQSCFVAMIPLTLLSCWSANASGIEVIFLESLSISTLSLFALSPVFRRVAWAPRFETSL
ncbi:hypothetical protein FGB62_169g04 [Gracilaria domingensis]|nr:hypothetical protein FGB62_169g04 [Gracilaria domingensis]